MWHLADCWKPTTPFISCPFSSFLLLLLFPFSLLVPFIFLTQDWECLQSTFLTRAERDDATTVNRLLPITPAQTLLSNTRQNITAAAAAATLSPSVYTTSQYQWNAMGQAHRISSHAANQTRNAIEQELEKRIWGKKFVWQRQRDFAVDSWLYYKCRDKESRTYVRIQSRQLCTQHFSRLQRNGTDNRHV